LPGTGEIVAGKYVVERVLGQGGMGVVLAARHQQLGELVAIKLLRSDGAVSAEAIERLMREARATISIKSEHVVRILDVGSLDDGSPYILMEFLSGSDLAEVVAARGPLPIAEAVDYILQTCEAVAEAHARGIVHRDLKPSNIFLTERADGSSLVKVLDFGISKALLPDDTSASGSNPQVSLTATRTVMGSPAFMSPEQVRNSKRVDERTDIWALGVILHELVTGMSPFSGEGASGLMAAIVADDPIKLRDALPQAPEGLEVAIAKCLVKERTERFQTVGELATALGPFAPEGSDRSIQRIVRMSQPVAQRRGSVHPSSGVMPVKRRGASDARPNGVDATAKAMTTSQHNTVKQRPWGTAVAWGAVVGTIVALAGGLTVLAIQRRASTPISPAPPSSSMSYATAVASPAPTPGTSLAPGLPSPAASSAGDGISPAPATFSAQPAPSSARPAPNLGHAHHPPVAAPAASKLSGDDHALDGR
jgi:serine/threonine-protein kinase